MFGRANNSRHIGRLARAAVPAVVILALQGCGGCGPSVAATCAVAYWPADGTAHDPVGAMNGTLEGGATFAAGKFGQAFSFDGTDDLVRVASAPLLNPTGSFTILAWVSPTESGAGPVIQKWGDAGDLARQRAYSVWLGGSTGTVGFSMSDDESQQNSGFHGLGTGKDVAPAGVWTHVSVVYDQATGKRTIYANGVSKATRTDPPTTVTNSTAPLAFGAHISSSTGFGEWYGGLLDDVRMFHVALTAEQIAAAAAASAAEPCI